MPPETITAPTLGRDLPPSVLAMSPEQETWYPGAPLRWTTLAGGHREPILVAEEEDLDLRIRPATVWFFQDEGPLAIDSDSLARITDSLERLVRDLLVHSIEGSRTWRTGLPPRLPRGRLLQVDRIEPVPLADPSPPTRPMRERTAVPEAGELRDLASLTVEECAELCQVQRSTFYNWLGGQGAPRGPRRRRLLELVAQLRGAREVFATPAALSTWLHTPAAGDAEPPFAYLRRSEFRIFRGLVHQARPRHEFRFTGSPTERRLALERLSPTPRIGTLRSGPDGGQEEDP